MQYCSYLLVFLGIHFFSFCLTTSTSRVEAKINKSLLGDISPLMFRSIKIYGLLNDCEIRLWNSYTSLFSIFNFYLSTASTFEIPKFKES